MVITTATFALMSRQFWYAFSLDNGGTIGFTVSGKYCAISIAQGGSGFPFFAKAVYDYFITGNLSMIHIKIDELPVNLLRHVVQQVCFS